MTFSALFKSFSKYSFIDLSIFYFQILVIDGNICWKKSRFETVNLFLPLDFQWRQIRARYVLPFCSRFGPIDYDRLQSVHFLKFLSFHPEINWALEEIVKTYKQLIKTCYGDFFTRKKKSGSSPSEIHKRPLVAGNLPFK